jgi:hypothetical protein
MKCPNPSSQVPHFTILPVASRFWTTSPREKDVMTATRCDLKDGVQELLDLGLAGLGIIQDLANKIYGRLHLEGMSLFLPFYHQVGIDHLGGGRDVEQD